MKFAVLRSKVFEWCDERPVLTVWGIIIGVICLLVLLVTLSIHFDGCPSEYRMTSVEGTVRMRRLDGTFLDTTGWHHECLKRETVK